MVLHSTTQGPAVQGEVGYRCHDGVGSPRWTLCFNCWTEHCSAGLQRHAAVGDDSAAGSCVVRHWGGRRQPTSAAFV